MMKVQNRTNTKIIRLLIGATVIAGFIVLGGPPLNPFPFPLGKKLPGQPPINKPMQSATVSYSDIEVMM